MTTNLLTLADRITAAVREVARNPCVTVKATERGVAVTIEHNVGAERITTTGPFTGTEPASAFESWAREMVQHRTGTRTPISLPGLRWDADGALAPARAHVQWRDGRSGGARDGD